MPETIETVAASDIAPGELGEDTRVTPTIGEGSGGETAAPGAAAALPAGDDQVDAAGVAYDAAKHEPSRKADGTWKLKRGSGARKAKGLPLTLPAGKSKSKVWTPPPATASAAQPGEATATSPGAAGVVVDAVPAPLTEADFAATAASVVGTTFALLALLLGAAWKLADDERAAWREAIARLWAHYQWSRVTPFLEVLSLGLITVEKRAGDAETKRRFGRVIDWLMPARAKRRPPPASDDQVDAKAAA